MGIRVVVLLLVVAPVRWSISLSIALKLLVSLVLGLVLEQVLVLVLSMAAAGLELLVSRWAFPCSSSTSSTFRCSLRVLTSPSPSPTAVRASWVSESERPYRGHVCGASHPGLPPWTSRAGASVPTGGQGERSRGRGAVEFWVGVVQPAPSHGGAHVQGVRRWRRRVWRGHGVGGHGVGRRGASQHGRPPEAVRGGRGLTDPHPSTHSPFLRTPPCPSSASLVEFGHSCAPTTAA